MVLIGEDRVTQFSFIEYQALMLALAGGICVGLSILEVALGRFQVLPLLFPGMFTVRDRRFRFFSFDVSDGAVGKLVRAEAKMVVRLSFCIVLSYLWTTCVLETTQIVGTDFPREQCLEGADCFASNLHFETIFTKQYEAVDCRPAQTAWEDFEETVVVSCIRFIPPQATTWLMHLAIAHSVTQLNFKCFELLVWISGNSEKVRRGMGFLMLLSAAVIIGLFFGGVMNEFLSSWLSFVMTLSTPVYLHSVWRGSRALNLLWHHAAESLNLTVEKHLDSAFSEIEPMLAREENEFRRSADVSLPTKNPSSLLTESEKRRRSNGTATLARVRFELSRIAASFGLRSQSGYSRPPTEASSTNPSLPCTPIGSSIPEDHADQSYASPQAHRETDQLDAIPVERQLFQELIPEEQAAPLRGVDRSAAAPVRTVSDGHTVYL